MAQLHVGVGVRGDDGRAHGRHGRLWQTARLIAIDAIALVTMPPNYYTGPTGHSHTTDVQSVQTAVLLVNLGTPTAPTAQAVRPYLAQFLGDTRVIDYPRWLWWLILHGVILRIRPARSAQTKGPT